MLILPAEADEAMVSNAVGRIEKIVSPQGGAIDAIDRWGRRRFAFEIAHQHEGYYVVVRFSAEPAAQAEIDRTLKLADEVIRHKVMVLPVKAKAASSPASKSEA
jgi:small subunit ribosomal protein S6